MGKKLTKWQQSGLDLQVEGLLLAARIWAQNSWKPEAKKILLRAAGAYEGEVQVTNHILGKKPEKLTLADVPDWLQLPKKVRKKK